MIDLKGIFPPIPTAFEANGDLAPARMQDNIIRLSRHALSGFLVLGSNGETVMLSDEEKIITYRAAREAIPERMLMLAGTGGQSTRETLHLTLAAAEAGADACVVLNPFYYKGLMTKNALVHHYHAIADASPVPVIIYNMPANTGIDMDGATLIAIAEHPNIVGLKDSGGNLAKMGEVISKTRPGFQVLAGSAGFLLPALSIGAVGGILALANILPAICLAIREKCLAHDSKGARHLQQQVISLNSLVTRDQGVPALKAAMDMLGMYGGPCREPIQPISSETGKALAGLLDEFKG